MPGRNGLGTSELIIASIVLTVLVFAPLLFAFSRARFRHPLLTAIPVSIAVFLVVVLVAGSTGVNVFGILSIIAIAAIVYGLSRPITRTSDTKCDTTSQEASTVRREASVSYQAQPLDLYRVVSEQEEKQRHKRGKAKSSEKYDECKRLLIQFVISFLMLIGIFLAGFFLDSTGDVPDAFEQILPLIILTSGGGMLIAIFGLVVNGWDATREAARMLSYELSRRSNGNLQTAEAKASETQNGLSTDEAEELTRKIAFLEANRELIKDEIGEYIASHPDESLENVVDFVTEKCFLENEINRLETELHSANKSLGKQSNSLTPLGLNQACAV